MIKKLFPFLSVIMLALFVGACSSEDVMPNIDQGASSRTVTFEALMPGSGPTTRVVADELADRSIDLKWEANDEIVLLFVQGTTKKSATATVVNAETGTFSVTLPEGIVGTTDYTLYGAYGTAGAPAEGSTIVDLASTGDLGNKILLHFEKAVTGNAIGSVDFVHKGYLFTAKVEITGGTVTNIGLAADTDWAISSSNYTFDLVSGAFATATAKANSIALENFAVKDGIATARSWFPATGTELPALRLGVNEGVPETNVAKPARTPVAGEAYYLYAKYDGTNLVFDDKGTKENPFTVAEAFGAQGRSDVWVKGYIVGVKTGQNYGVDFTGVTTTNTNLVITDNKDETDPQKALGVQLPKGTVRNALNLAENTSMYKAEVLLKGDLDAYFGSDEGLKNVDEYEIISTEPFFIADLNELIFQASGDALSNDIAISTDIATQAWTAESDATWLTVTPVSGIGSGSIGVTAQENSAETERTATVTITPTANAELTPIVVNVTQLGTVAPPAELLFPGSDFNDWATFTSSLNTYGLKDYATESAAGGRDGSGAIHINGTPTGNDYVFTAVVPEGFSAVGRTMIHFWIKGTAAKSLSLNVYTGSGYKPYNLGSATADVVLEPVGSNQYVGTIDTGGEWIKVSLNISTIANDISSTPGDDLFALKVGKTADYDLFVDDITIE